MGRKIELISDYFKNDQSIKVFKNYDLKKYSTMRLASRGDLILVRSKDALKNLLAFMFLNKISYSVLGLGANQLLNEEIENPIIKIDFDFDFSYLEKEQVEYHLPASITLSKLSSHAIKFGLIGWEVFTGIPATLGGAIFMNAGTELGEIGNLVSSVTFINKKGEEVTKRVSSKDFSYRQNLFLADGDIVCFATLKNLGKDKKISELINNYLKKRNSSQPLSEFTAGCTFKNNTKGCRAGHYLDIMGLKGFSSKNFRVSHKHANFIENFGDGTYSEVVDFMDFIQSELKLQYGVEFEFEVKH